MTEPHIRSASDIKVDTEALEASISEFAEKNGAYYGKVFQSIHQSKRTFPITFNAAAAILGPLWGAMRGLWGYFWGALILELIAWVQIGRGLWGNLGGEAEANALRQSERAAGFTEKSEAAIAAGEDPARFENLANNMTAAAERSQTLADQANAEAPMILISGLAILLMIKFFQSVYANISYEKQYTKWRIDPEKTEAGVKPFNILLGLGLVAAIVPLTLINFTFPGEFQVLEKFPANSDHYAAVATWLDDRIDAAATAGSGFFDSIVAGVRTILKALTIALIGTPWPVVMTVIAVVSWRSAGPRVAIFSVAAMAYLALLGFWEVSMETVALVGAAVFICVGLGIPLGIWFGKSERAYKFSEPILDLMQTLPAFVYLIPIIAFFGTGNPPGILATIIFGMPPVIRLTALGMRGVPESIKEGAMAFGATRWQLLKDVEVPLALPSIMAGVNQTILMCLSMVVIISLIGGGGLGKTILEALQYAAKGPGLLGGFAILFCAMVIDRIVQGAFKSKV